MAHWEYMVKLGDVFHADMAFAAKRDVIVERIRASQWFSECHDSIADLVDRLARTSDTRAFNRVWNIIYDRADVDRAWIETR